jgi:hypothetical protein
MSSSLYVPCSEPEARILGDEDIFVQSASSLNITCLVTHLPEETEDIRWLHEDKVENQVFAVGQVRDYVAEDD